MAAHHGLAHCAGLPVVVRSASTAKWPSLSNAEATTGGEGAQDARLKALTLQEDDELLHRAGRRPF